MVGTPANPIPLSEDCANLVQEFTDCVQGGWICDV